MIRGRPSGLRFVILGQVLSPIGSPKLEESWKPRKFFRGGRQREWQSVALLIRDSALR